MNQKANISVETKSQVHTLRMAVQKIRAPPLTHAH